MTFKIKDWTLKDMPTAPTIAYDDAEARLDAVDVALSEFPADYVKAMRAACAALREPLDFVVGAFKAAAMRYAQQKATADEATRLAEEAVPKNVDVATPNARPQAVRAATSSIFDGFWKSKVEEVARDRQAKADEIARACIEAMKAAKLSLDRAIADATGPIALRAPIDVDRLSTIAALRDELRSYKPTALLRLFETFVSNGDEEKELLFQQACEPLLDEMMKLSLLKLAERLEMRRSPNERNSGEVGKERDAIAQLRRRIAEREADRVPEALMICEAAFAQLVGAFSLIFGTHAMVLSRAEYEQRYLRSTPDALAINPSWVAKALPPNAPRQ